VIHDKFPAPLGKKPAEWSVIVNAIYLSFEESIVS